MALSNPWQSLPSEHHWNVAVLIGQCLMCRPWHTSSHPNSALASELCHLLQSLQPLLYFILTVSVLWLACPQLKWEQRKGSSTQPNSSRLPVIFLGPGGYFTISLSPTKLQAFCIVLPSRTAAGHTHTRNLGQGRLCSREA